MVKEYSWNPQVFVYDFAKTAKARLNEYNIFL